MTSVERAAAAAKAALDAKLDALRCVRCGQDYDPAFKTFCRDDHDHSFRPVDHWLQKRGQR